MLLFVLLGIAVLVLALAVVVLLPILTHQSAGESGQELPDGYVSETSAEGADGRARSLEVIRADGSGDDLSDLQAGERIVVRGEGFDAGIGIYVGFCAIPEEPGEKPRPCLGGIPDQGGEASAEDEEPGASAWVTDDWAWRAFATQRYDDAERGAFEVVLTVPEASEEGIDCTEQRCAIATRADHTAGSDRVQDLLLPVAYASDE